jgi:hypothetical protein
MAPPHGDRTGNRCGFILRVQCIFARKYTPVWSFCIAIQKWPIGCLKPLSTEFEKRTRCQKYNLLERKPFAFTKFNAAHIRAMLIADLTHFLAPDGSIGPKDGPARGLADYLTKIVIAATASIQMQSGTTVVHCRKRPNRRLCSGEIETDIDPETKQIIWWCPVCGEEGSISHWQGSLWDCTNNAQSH